MTLGAWYYLCLFLFLIFSAWWGWRKDGDRWFSVGALLLVLMLLILGLREFGGPIR